MIDRLRVGLFGILGSGNLGNDASLDAVLNYLMTSLPDAQLSFFCAGPVRIGALYAVSATSWQWYELHAGKATGVFAVMLKILGKLLDPFRTLAWVRRQDVVLVPGMGVLEATVPVRPWAMPYSLFWLGLAGRLFQTKIALVSVGSNYMDRRSTRWLFAVAARLVHYRSYRDEASREAADRMGVDVSADQVYADLAFALPTPPTDSTGDGTVAVGLMNYRGGNDDRARAGEIHLSYVRAMTDFLGWLLATGRTVRLFSGDQEDRSVIAGVLADLQRRYRWSDMARLLVEPADTLQDVMEQLAPVDAVVATRYHNVLAALTLCKPTVAVGYALKHEILMADAGMGEFCHPARTVDVERLVTQFNEVEKRAEELRAVMAERRKLSCLRVHDQFADLSRTLFPGSCQSEVSSDGHSTSW